MTRQIFLASAWLLAFASGALAHSFNVVMVVPADWSQEVRTDMINGFLVASAERDSHANEESDGHLGGLDVYITLAGDDQTSRIAKADPDIIVLVADTNAQPGDAVTFRPLPTRGPKGATYLMRGEDHGFAPFTERFTASTGAYPREEANVAYVAARQIDDAVRRLDGVDDRAALADRLN
jgi:hypothetical protein